MASSLFKAYQTGQTLVPVIEDKENVLPESCPQPSSRLGGVLSSAPSSKQQPTRGSVGKGRTPLSDITSLCLAQEAITPQQGVTFNSIGMQQQVPARMWGMGGHSTAACDASRGASTTSRRLASMR